MPSRRGRLANGMTVHFDQRSLSMSDFIHNMLSLDPLAVTFLVASLLSLWAIWRVVSDPLDLSSSTSDETDAGPVDGDAPRRDEPQATEGPPAPRAGGRKARGPGRAA
jgi:hypothetical protein